MKKALTVVAAVAAAMFAQGAFAQAASSPFRADVKANLEREIRVSNSREQIEALYAELTTENIVKGWAPVK